MGHKWPVGLAVLLVAAPAAGNAGHVPDVLFASAVEFRGAFTLTGELVALVAEDVDGRGTAAVDGSIAAGRWTVETVASYRTAAGVTYDEPATSRAGSWPAADLSVAQEEGGYFVFLKNGTGPLRVAMTMATGRLASSGGPSAAFGDFLRGAGATPSADVTGALRLPVQGDLDLALDGDAQLSLWTFTARAGDDTLWSGPRRVPLAGTPSPADAAAWRSEEQVVHAQLDGASLDVQMRGVPGTAIYLRDLRLDGVGQITLRQPTSLADADPMGSTLALDGPAQIAVDGAGGGQALIRVISAGDASLDGAPVRLATSATPAAPLVVPALLAGVAAAAAVVVVPRTARLRLRAMESHLHRRDYVWVATRAGPALRSARTARRAAAYKATSLLALGEFKEARLFLAGLAPDRRPDRATYHFLTAHAASGLRQDDAATQELASCLAIEPSYRADAEAIPVLQRILRLQGVANPQGGAVPYT